MYRVKQLFGGSLTQRDYDGQVAEALAMARTEQNDKGRYARKRSSCLKTPTGYREVHPKSDLYNKASEWSGMLLSPRHPHSVFCPDVSFRSYFIVLRGRWRG